MMTLRVCPSTLAEGFDTYSPAARKKMFDDKAVAHYLKVPSPSTNRSHTECKAHLIVGRTAQVFGHC